MARSIKTIPHHCQSTTSSFNSKKAISTETGNSKEATILPKPNPVFGKPAFNNIGGIIVPKKAKNNP